LDSRRKFSLTPLAIQTTRTLSIPKTNPKSDSNPKTKHFPGSPHGCLWKKRKWNIKGGGEVFTTQRDNQWTPNRGEKGLL